MKQVRLLIKQRHIAYQSLLQARPKTLKSYV